MIAARAAGVHRAPALVIAVAIAALLRTAAGGAAPAASVPAAALFSALLAAAAVWGGATLAPLSWRGVALGVAGGAALVAVALVGVPAVVTGPRAVATTLLWWAPLVTMVAATEELVLRGVLFEAIGREFGAAIAVAATALLFAVIHLPLYRTQALPIEIGRAHV